MPLYEPSANDRALARFFRALGSAALDLAKDLESKNAEEQGWLSIDQASLGSLQRQVAEVPGINSEVGMSPREITRQLTRDDEPNIRTALAAMAKRGVTELVPAATPQRWRLTAAYRRPQVSGTEQDAWR
jgi:hypothetical protein